MRRLSRVLNRPVVDVESGSVVGKVVDFACDLEHGKIAALLVESPDLPGPAAVTVDDVASVGRDAVTVRNRKVVTPLRDMPGVSDLVQKKAGWRTRRLMTVGGREAGQVSDLMVSNDLKRVVQVEVSGGLVSDLVDGRKRFKIAGPDVLVVGEDAVILRSHETPPVPDEGLDRPGGA